MKEKTTTIYLRGADARNFMKAVVVVVVVVDRASIREGSEANKHVPLLGAMEAAQRELLTRADKAEAERDALAHTFAEVADAADSGDAPLGLCE